MVLVVVLIFATFQIRLIPFRKPIVKIKSLSCFALDTY